MKTHRTQSRGLITLLAVLSLALGSQFSTTFAQGSSFTYQGSLNDSGSAASGNYDLRFTLFDAATNGNSVAGPITNSPTVVSNGLFTVTLDFGAAPFTGADLWLEIAARTNGAFTVLSPRQKITATPYSVTARNVTGVLPGTGLAGTYGSAVAFNNAGNSFSGSFSGSGAGLTSVNAASLGGLSSSQFWKTAGNSGTSPTANFVGTTDNQPLELRVNNLRGLRVQPGSNSSPSVIGGSRSNIISLGVAGATIAGGDRNFIESFFPLATSDYAFLGGGSSNYIGYFSFNSVLGGGYQNALNPNCYYSIIAGGLSNSMGYHSVHSVISGGRSNSIYGSVDTSTIGGGSQNYIDFLAHFDVIGAGLHNQILSNAEYAVINGGRFNTIGVDADDSTIGGGQNNEIKSGGTDCTIAGGAGNSISYFSGTISGGTGNSIETNSYEGTIGGGSANMIQSNAERSTISGGVFQQVFSGSSYSFIGGGEHHMAKSNAFHATICGGSNNQIQNDTSYCFIGGGKLHTVSPNANHATIAGGDGNIAGGEAPAIGGGTLNQIGTGTTYDTIVGGGGNSIGAGTFGATVAGGYVNQVNGDFSFAAGYKAQANHPGTFAWAGGNTMPYASTIPYTCNLYASNGVSMDYSFQTAGSPRGVRYVFIGQNAGNTISTWNGARLTDAGVWSNVSDRNRKTDFKEVNPRAVLDKLATMPVRQWRYTNEDACVKHIGPVAQDFQATFGLGTDDKTIGTVDADGVALAAIQGLNQKLEERCKKADSRVENLEAENAELKSQLAEIKALVQSLAKKSEL